MAKQVEFYFSSIWAIKPYAVREEIIPRLKGSEFHEATFLFDNSRNWFHITCLAKDEPMIRELLKTCLDEIQEQVYDNEEDIVDDDNALVKEVNSHLIGIWNERALLEAWEFLEHRFPETFQLFAFQDVWSLNYGSIQDIMTGAQFRELEKDNNVVLGYNLSFTEVYMGAESKEELQRVTAKLNTLTQAKEVIESEPTHLLWTEAYKERDGFVMTFDTRFLSNIDPKLVKATFLDFQGTDAAQDYLMLAEAITIRLCRYDHDRGFHTSLVGPKLKPRPGSAGKVGKRRYRRLNRPGAMLNPYGAGFALKRPLFKSPEPKAAAMGSDDSPFQGDDVAKWLDGLEKSCGLFRTVGHTASSSASVAGARSSLLAGADQDLISFADLEPVPPTTCEQQVGRMKGQGQDLLDLDDVFTAPSLKPLTPQFGNIPAPTVGNTAGSAAPFVNVGSSTKSNGRAPSQASSRVNGSTVTVATTSGTDVATKDKARPDVASAQLPNWFIAEINQAVSALVAKGPFLRGKVDLRADIGRILMNGMDYTGLAFNAPGSESNGWKFHEIVELLNNGSRTADGHTVTFTKILTQEEDDINHMRATVDIATGKELWKSTTTEGVMYSLYCVSKGHAFFLDLKPNSKNLKFSYTFRTKHDDKSPIWIHCTLRSWDVRIVMSHVDTHLLEAKYGEFARSFVDSFAVSLHHDDHPQIQIGVHKGFGISVESMRIHTTYRFISADEMTYLDITEVEDTVFNLCGPVPGTAGPSSRDQWRFYNVEPKRSPADVRASEERGMPTFWYEACVRSVVAEKEMAANATMALGEKAPWNLNRLADLGVVANIVKPVLRMVQLMDSVGAYNDNYQRELEQNLPQPNATEVPGANYVTHESPVLALIRRNDSPAATHTSRTSSVASRGRIPIATPATDLLPIFPPGTVVHRDPKYGYATTPVKATSPGRRGTATIPAIPFSAAAAAAAVLPGWNAQNAPPATPSRNDQNVIRAFAPASAGVTTPNAGGAGGGAGGFSVAGQRDASANRQQGHQQPSSTGSDASRGPIPSHKPPSQFW
ncbi:hypothetical protein GE09DRAFT_1213401 [Coniochaeta sp. 2T2.1]|nr:hypothetical protein GE09DRAFT_1213401 [Coniochaeta sp. 2T2.1]